MSIMNRMQAPTPKFFKILRTVGISLAAVGGTLLTAPLALPAAVLTLAGYVSLAGAVITAVSQTAVESEERPTKAE
ncbi:hypothetical protein [Chryseolinea sp. H1M3-3]|uniref:hypothetical protein n=1 Tax=Chryseolinea sp. H1M3-3 TaxID=3034144 RepID=UPI0023ED1B4A|nr:hypothetical protein [Chryseolinea sp. H1M3-3]